MNKFYEEINKALLSYETNKPYHPRKLDWICNRIHWCWKWKKISESQMEELIKRVIVFLHVGAE